MKKFLVIIGLAVAVLSASAQSYDSETLLTAVAQPASTATNRNVIVDCAKQSSFALQVECMNDAAGAAPMTFAFQRSVDRVIWSNIETIALPFNGVTKQTTVTNIPTYGAGYWKIAYTTNAHTTINCTNLTVKWAKKSQAN